MKKTVIALTLLSLTLPFSFANNVRSQRESADTCANGHATQVAFTLVDQNGEIPSGVTKEDLILKIDGDVTPVLAIDLQSGSPVDLAILIDVSVSQADVVGVTKPVAKALLQEFLRSSKNRVALISFSNTIEVNEALTSDVPQLVAALDKVKCTLPQGYVSGGIVVGTSPPRRSASYPGATSLWDTSTAVVENIFGAARDESRKRAMVLLTDGDDTASKGKLNASIKSARDHDVAIYSIGIAGSDFEVKRDSLKKVAEDTGGVAAFPKTREDLKSAVIEIQKRLGSQYSVSFCRDTKKTDHYKVRMDLTNPKFRNARVAYAREQ